MGPKMTRPSSNNTVAGQRRAVLLLSGGLDSYTTGAMAKADGFGCYALTVAYGQRHSREVDCADRAAQSLGVLEHKTIKLDLRSFGGSALTDDLAVPKTDVGPIGTGGPIGAGGIPCTYVPARNTILLSLALGWAEALKVFDIFIGANAVDYSGYPDCRAEFIGAFEGLANLATAAAVQGQGRFRVHAPLIGLSKSEIIQKGKELGLDYSLTHSCYDPDDRGRACGRCDSCLLRLKGFNEAHIHDPIEYMPR